MQRPYFGLVIACLISAFIGVVRGDEGEDFFEAKIRPTLLANCFRCHGDNKTSGELRVDSREFLLKGGESGAAIIPGKVAESLLVQAIKRIDGVSAMPPDGEKPLRPDQIADIEKWIASGAQWPAASPKFQLERHWSFEPIRNVDSPDVIDRAWPKTSIDFFVRAKQEAAGVAPVSQTDKRSLIRRATYDLTGLPPTPDEVSAFLSDDSAQSFEKVIDRLLASKAYGERWGRHWLDVVRYSDTAGETADYPIPSAWRYRNYVIDAFNDDKPFDVFLREQIAGDILASRGPPERYSEQVVATGYLAISRRFGFDSENYQHLTIQDTIDTLGQSVLGLSLGCARCHDHKFDPLSMRDYYALYGIFDSSRYPFPGSEQKQRVRSLSPLLPAAQSRTKWHDFDQRVSQLKDELAKQNKSVPNAILRSVLDMDGDFELQAAAAGGSNGVLVAPWRYQGKIAVTNSSQSPFQNLYFKGNVGVSVPVDAGAYRIEQAVHPRRARGECKELNVNVDFRVGPSNVVANQNESRESVTVAPKSDLQKDDVNAHRISVGSMGSSQEVEVLISSEGLALKSGKTIELICSLNPQQWYNLQLKLDLENGTVSGIVGVPNSLTKIPPKNLASDGSGSIDHVAFDSIGNAKNSLPAIDYDNFGLQEEPILVVSTESPHSESVDSIAKTRSLQEQLQSLIGNDGDLEVQSPETPLVSPWNAGPNSVVKVFAYSQSPFENVFAPGRHGIRMPNRAEYDGLGLTLTKVAPDSENRLYASFDFRCENQEMGGGGSWRYYLGHGAGSSAAIELYFNGTQFFHRSHDDIKLASSLDIGKWYQVQLTLDVENKTYLGVLESEDQRTEFTGQLASGWDGNIDYTFVDSFGHLGGVRPSLDADNFFVGDHSIPSIKAKATDTGSESRTDVLAKIAGIRRQLDDVQKGLEKDFQELESLLNEGPCAMAYAMAEGTPHNVQIQIRGEPDQLGAEVPRGFIKILGGASLPAETGGSGRLPLAEFLTSADNPLTSRVMVNRIWQNHFGRGIVETPNDFGVRGKPPTHPELLDHLATLFVRNGWSVKAMHRLIMLSATYQQSCDAISSKSDSKHPSANRELFVSFLRRRLDAEEIRDSILAVCGELDRTPGKEHSFPSPTSWGFTQHAPFNAFYDHNKRSIYLMTPRIKRHPFLALFDGPDPNATTADRASTMVPTQALYFLNDPFVHANSESWARHLLERSSDESKFIARAYLTALSRDPTENEIREATAFLASYREELRAASNDNVETHSLAAFLRTLLGSNEFLFVE